MVDKLRKRVVTYTVLAVLLVLILLMGTLNIANYVVKDRAADAMLEFLAENGGALNCLTWTISESFLKIQNK